MKTELMVFVHGWGLGREKGSFWPESLEEWSQHQPRWEKIGEQAPGAQLWASEFEASLDDQRALLSTQPEGEVQVEPGNLGAAA